MEGFHLEFSRDFATLGTTDPVAQPYYPRHLDGFVHSATERRQFYISQEDGPCVIFLEAV